MDKDPPLISSLIVGTGEPNTYTTYDVLGRVIFLGVSAKF
jgi:iron complex outermembrane recepter protein